MKKNYFFTFLITLVCSTIGFSQVTMPFYEGFDYATGSDLGDAANWNNFSGNSNPINVVGAGLSYSGLKASTGKAIMLQGGAIDSEVVFAEVTSGEVFASFIIKVTNLADLTDFTDGGYFAILGGSGFNARLWVRAATDPAGSTFDFTITNASSGTGFGDDYNVGDDVFVVMSYHTTTGVLNAWINPSASDFEGSAPAVTHTATDGSPNPTSNFKLRQDSTGETPGMIIDELRLGTTWADVTPKAATASIGEDVIKGFATYPNPINNGFVTVSTFSSNAKEVIVYNVIGKKVLSETFTGTSKRINVSTLHKGIYLMKVIEGDKIAIKKLIVN